MRMKNPFSDEPGDEESEAAETRAGQTRESEQPEDQPDDQLEASESRADDEPAEKEHDSPTAESGSDDDAGSDDDSDLGPNQQRAGVTAPSIGPDTVIERKPPEERLDFDKISDQDAMGEDKRREVVGKSYGPSRTRVFGTFAAFIAIVAAVTVGFYFLAKELDQPPAENPDEAPWSQADAPQSPPRPLQ
jgi:hypothetical protein